MDEYFKALRNNLDAGRHEAVFGDLMGSLDACYGAVIRRPPKGQLIFGRLLLVCHKAMLSAATLITQKQPEDSVGVTRRALEVARVAIAIKVNDENALQWTAYQDRHDRWLRREQGQKPKSFHVHFKNIEGEPLMSELDRFLGILSDAYVHFTPEFYASLDWDERKEPGGSGEIFLHYFHRSIREIERHYLVLASVHGLILKVFDKCFDGGISGDAERLAHVNRFWDAAQGFNDAYKNRYGAVPDVTPE